MTIIKADLVAVAGMLDAKATAYRRKRTGIPIIELRTKNKDLVRRLRRAVRVGVVYGPYKREGEKDTYLWQAFGEERVREVYEQVGEYLGPTLRRKIKAALTTS